MDRQTNIRFHLPIPISRNRASDIQTEKGHGKNERITIITITHAYISRCTHSMNAGIRVNSNNETQETHELQKWRAKVSSEVYMRYASHKTSYIRNEY